MADRYETALTPPEEQSFQKWKAANAPNDSGADYDLRGAFKSGVNPAANGHWPDTFKKPNHPTFSNESQYATADAPHWEGDRLISKSGKVVADETQKAQSGWTPVAESAPGWTPVRENYNIGDSQSRIGHHLETHPIKIVPSLVDLAVSPITAIPAAVRQVADFIRNPSGSQGNLNPQTANGIPGAMSVNPPAEAYGDAAAAFAMSKGTPKPTIDPEYLPKPKAPSVPGPGSAVLHKAVRFGMGKLFPGGEMLYDLLKDAAQDKPAAPKPPAPPPEATAPVPKGTPTPEMLKQASKPFTPAEQKLADDILAGVEPTPQAAPPSAPPAAFTPVTPEDLYAQAVKTVRDAGKGSTSTLQRNLRVGYTVAEGLLNKMEQDGIVGPAQGSKPRPLLGAAPAAAPAADVAPAAAQGTATASPGQLAQFTPQQVLESPQGRATPAAEMAQVPVKKVSPGAKTAQALSDKLMEWKFTPDEARELVHDQRSLNKLAFEAGVQVPTPAVLKDAIFNLTKRLAGPSVTIPELIERFRAGGLKQ